MNFSNYTKKRQHTFVYQRFTISFYVVRVIFSFTQVSLLTL